MNSLNEKEFRMEQLVPLILEQLKKGNTVRFSPRGVSMLPMLRQGRDSVVFSAAPQTLRKYDLPLYQRENGKYLLHRIIKAGETYICVGDNQFKPEPPLDRSRILAVVVGFYRDDKYYSVDHWGYRLYCRFWHYSRPLRHFWRRGIGWLKRHLKKKTGQKPE